MALCLRANLYLGDNTYWQIQSNVLVTHCRHNQVIQRILRECTKHWWRMTYLLITNHVLCKVICNFLYESKSWFPKYSPVLKLYRYLKWYLLTSTIFSHGVLLQLECIIRLKILKKTRLYIDFLVNPVFAKTIWVFYLRK